MAWVDSAGMVSRSSDWNHVQEGLALGLLHTVTGPIAVNEAALYSIKELHSHKKRWRITNVGRMRIEMRCRNPCYREQCLFTGKSTMRLELRILLFLDSTGLKVIVMVEIDTTTGTYS